MYPVPLRYKKGHCFAPWFAVFADKSAIKMYVSTDMWNDYSYREKNRSTRRETSPSANSCTANVTGSNLVLRGERLASVRLSLGTACMCAC